MNIESNSRSYIEEQIRQIDVLMQRNLKSFNMVEYNKNYAIRAGLINTLSNMKEQVEAQEFFSDMTNEDRLRFNLNTSAISILSDLMYGYIVDSNALIQKHDPYSSIEQFDSFLKAGTEAKKAYKFFLESGTDNLREELTQASDEILMTIDSMLKQKVSKILIDKTKKK